MTLGRVVGTVVATRKEEKLQGFKLLVIGRCQARRSGTDDCYPFAGVDNIRHIRAPALCNCFVGYVFFNAADRYSTVDIVECAGTFAEPVLRTYPPTDFWQ